jgi:hypothetical protein
MGCGTGDGCEAIAARRQEEKTMATDRELLSAMEKLDKILSTPSAKALTVSRARALDAGDFCAVYQKIRPVLSGPILDAIAKIPIVGKIVPVIRLLMQIADFVCHIR